MIESTMTQSAVKLFEALERLGQSSGSGLSSGGPSGQPSEELIKQFQEAMEGFSAEAQGQGLQGSQMASAADGVNGAQGVDGINGAEFSGSVPDVDALAQSAPVDPGPAERMPPVEETPDAIQVEYVVPDDQGGVSRVQSLADTAGPDATHATGESANVGADRLGATESFADASNSGPSRVRVDSDRTLHVPEGPSAPERTYQSSQSTPSNQEDLLREVGQILENITRPGSTILPTDLYRLQYLTGMLKVGSQTGLKASQQTTQGMESVLKQNG